MDKQTLAKAVRDYGGVRSKKFFAKMVADNRVIYFEGII
jgi:hypothetical protein